MRIFVPVMISVVVVFGWFAIRAGEKRRDFCDSGGTAMTYRPWRKNDGCASIDSEPFSLYRSGRGRAEGLTGLQA